MRKSFKILAFSACCLPLLSSFAMAGKRGLNVVQKNTHGLAKLIVGDNGDLAVCDDHGYCLAEGDGRLVPLQIVRNDKGQLEFQ